MASHQDGRGRDRVMTCVGRKLIKRGFSMSQCVRSGVRPGNGKIGRSRKVDSALGVSSGSERQATSNAGRALLLAGHFD
jgi:hypothetical protein